ncbi:putative cell wall glycosyl hydrolase Dfg5 [Aspergillus sclerotioniger CBS 115572]|uniref:Mannan endo-1,6-alpha-mannosidase n=1 Tax=Aspergillus sclerotioniger CBS 115572 TaxID=1450535 RepID=A0A317XBK5_9EURO|nr:putative cell wall glycosyl hydrolase Dfg5 [Aspergillus sclerotioniger CBS 115572]PWY95956.1 putative cell wall glycosyl hydrolase Dfg5 [Aspergillus sclerotioniger CBS 115572]
MYPLWLWYILILTVAVQAIGFDLDNPESIKTSLKPITASLLTHYTGNHPGDNPGNLPPPYYWWEAGALFTTLLNYHHLTHDTTYLPLTIQALTWQSGPSGSFMPANQTRTEGNDDQSFWAFGAMSAAEQNLPDPAPELNVPGWLGMAQAVFNTQAERWDTGTCGGGLRWQIFPFNEGWMYKNTISNGGFFQLAARLARFTGNGTYAEWAERVWEWTEETVGFVTPEFRVWDGAGVESECRSWDRIEWSYNSGVFLLGAAVMFNLTESPTWRARTEGLLNTSSSIFFQDDNVMYERACEPVNTCEVDQRSFKGYLARWMAATTQMAPFTADQIMPKIRASAKAAAETCTGGESNVTCGLKWTERKWDGMDDVGVQMAALEVMQSTLIGMVEPPVTRDTGGMSQGNPGGGEPGQEKQPVPEGLRREITHGDRAGAGLLTVLVSLVVMGSTGWLVYE